MIKTGDPRKLIAGESGTNAVIAAISLTDNYYRFPSKKKWYSLGALSILFLLLSALVISIPRTGSEERPDNNTSALSNCISEHTAVKPPLVALPSNAFAEAVPPPVNGHEETKRVENRSPITLPFPDASSFADEKTVDALALKQ